MELKVALVNSAGFTDTGDIELINYSDQLRASSSSYNIKIDQTYWRDLSIDWTLYDIVIIRACWDSHLHSSDFKAWIRRLEKLNVLVSNPLSLVSWNINKEYLLDLSRAGVSILRSWFIDRNVNLKKESGVWVRSSIDGREEIRMISDLVDEIRRLGVKKLVLKPTKSASGFMTSLVSVDELQALLQDRLRTTSIRNWIVQEFASEIVEEGEWSCIYFNGVFSHCVKRQPEKGDFIVQDVIAVANEDVPLELRKFSSDVLLKLSSIPTGSDTKMPLYARVDMIRSGQSNVHLMELELIEPSFFINRGQSHLIKNYHDAIVQRGLDNSKRIMKESKSSC